MYRRDTKLGYLMKRNRNRARNNKNQVIVQKMQSRIYCLVVGEQWPVGQEPENSRVRKQFVCYVFYPYMPYVS